MNDDLQKQLINDLLLESFEGLDRFDGGLLALENGTQDAETMNVIFRVIHSIKGTAGCIGLPRIEATAHAGESLLSLLREGQVAVTSELISALLALSDALRSVFRHLEATGSEGTPDHHDLVLRLERLQKPVAKKTGHTAFGLFGQTVPPMPAPVNAAAPEPAAAAAPTASSTGANRASVSDSAIRVDVSQLDKLMNLVGELVLARNQIVQNAGNVDPSALQTASQRLNHITTELQESVMKTRMQPIENVWAKFPRVVRDVAMELGKQVHLEMFGSDTELDRTIIEAIKDPLTHIIRNSIDHGIERPEERQKNQKPAQGSLILRAFHEGGQVNIEVIDDGAGINLERVKKKAVERGLVSPEQAARMSDREIQNLVFAPGLSTAEKVTNLSGRGVGMDVVKTNLEKIGGTIDLKSERGQGTTLKIKIPLTLAIIPALVVSSSGERFAIPQVSLLELVRLEPETAATAIENLSGVPVYRLRGQLLPLCYLNRELGLTPPGDAHKSEATNIVVLQADGRPFGLMVDDVHDTEEIVVKPLGKQLRGIACFSGATIMGDGRVALILDVLGLAQRANVVQLQARERVVEEAARDTARQGNRQSWLILESANRRVAVPLSTIARLEEIPSQRVEKSGGQDVVQYRGAILPLIPVDRVIGAAARDFADPMQVVVYTENGQHVGLVVDRISDIVEEVIDIRRDVPAQGVLGSIVVQNRVTDVLDMSALLQVALTHRAA